ncbi:MAG TPA: aspartate kinase [Waddliaceae bacterium]
MKFGGASVATPEHFSRIADLILSKKHKRLVIVASAMGNTTDQLIALAKEVNPDPPRREYDMLVTVGERISISLLAMALARKGHEAVSYTGSQSGIITTPDHSDAKIIDVKPHRLLYSLNIGKIVIVAGFQGVSTTGEITTLGRGGSDTTAVALGIALKAPRVEFYKDVPGIFDADPRLSPDSKKFSTLTYDEALTIVQRGAKVLHDRCLNLAKINNIPLYVSSFQEKHGEAGTWIKTSRKQSESTPTYEHQSLSRLD